MLILSIVFTRWAVCTVIKYQFNTFFIYFYLRCSGRQQDSSQSRRSARSPPLHDNVRRPLRRLPRQPADCPKWLFCKRTNKTHREEEFRKQNNALPKQNMPPSSTAPSQTGTLLKLRLCQEKSIWYMDHLEFIMGEGNIEYKHQKGKRIQRA